jgi:hypothetical protein
MGIVHSSLREATTPYPERTSLKPKFDENENNHIGIYNQGLIDHNGSSGSKGNCDQDPVSDLKQCFEFHSEKCRPFGQDVLDALDSACYGLQETTTEQ